MNKNELMAKVSRNVNKLSLSARRNSPHILIAVGAVTFVSTVVMACVATRRLDDIFEEQEKELEIIDDNFANDEEISRKETTKAYVHTGLQIAKLYAPAVGMGILSLTCILSSHNILTKRNLAINAAYATLNKSFQGFQDRVAEKYGDEALKELKYGIRKEKVEGQETDPETGKTKKVKKEIEVASGIECSPYARFFDETSRHYERDAEDNLFFLKAEQHYANEKLRARGYLFLNEVYERLGFPATKAGQCVGWYWNPDDPDTDDFVSFGIYKCNSEKKRDFVNGYEPSILLDFNVSGNILDKFHTNQLKF